MSNRSTRSLPVQQVRPLTAQESQQLRQDAQEGRVESSTSTRSEGDRVHQEWVRWQERARQEAREFFGYRFTENAGAHQERQHADRVRHEQARAQDAQGGPGVLDEREELRLLRSRVRLAGDDYMRSVARSGLLVPGMQTGKAARQVDVLHGVYGQMMLQACMRPLAQGVRPGSVIQVAGMMATLSVLSPAFRDALGDRVDAVRDAVRDRIDARTASVAERAQKRAAAQNAALDARIDAAVREKPELANDPRFMKDLESYRVDRDSLLSDRWKRRLEKMEHRQRGHREMFTPHSAAMTEVALAENAYYRMREPGVDPDEIHRNYRALRKRLWQQFEDDGLTRQDVVSQSRQIIGERLEFEPELRCVFTNIGHGRVVKSGVTTEVDASGRSYQRWDGSFSDHLGNKADEDGMFLVRKVESQDSHREVLADTMALALKDSLTRAGGTRFKDDVMGYVVGFAAQRHGQDTRGMPAHLQGRFEQSEVILASMYQDGLTAEQMQEVYSNAFVDAAESLEADPRLRQAFNGRGFSDLLTERFGPSWQQDLSQAVSDPHWFMEQQSRARTSRPGSGHEQDHPQPEQDYQP